MTKLGYCNEKERPWGRPSKSLPDADWSFATLDARGPSWPRATLQNDPLVGQIIEKHSIESPVARRQRTRLCKAARHGQDARDGTLLRA